MTDKGTIHRASAVNDLERPRWAVLVGVSNYQSPRLELHYAANDIEKVWEALQSPRCGGFAESRVKKLVDDQATVAAVTDALRSFLMDAKEDDLVLLYFSGHGGRDHRRPGPNDTTYFFTWETDPENVAGTALPMSEILTSLDQNLRARRVILMMDTCHGAAVGQKKGQTDNRPIELQQYLAALQRADEGFAIFTSSESGEASREDVRWGGGHGLFTHLILEGLSGHADRNPQNGYVTLGKLIDYVTERAGELGGQGAQHPSVGNRQFDRDLVMAVTGGVSAQERLEVGEKVLRMAVESGHPGRYEAAARYLEEADKLAAFQGGLPEARALAGLAYLGAGKLEQASRVLRQTSEAGHVESQFFLAAARAMSHAFDDAVKLFERFVREHGQHPRAGMAGLMARLLCPRPERKRPGREHALLIGVSRVAGGRGSQLRGPAHDVASMGQLLSSLGFESVTRVEEERATRDGILGELGRLAAACQPDDVVVVHYSGHSSRDASGYLVPYDATSKELVIRPEELHEQMEAIPATSKLLVLDTDPNDAFMNLASRPGTTYNVLFGAARGQLAREMPISDDNVGGVATRALVEAIGSVGVEARWSEIVAAMLAAIPREARQTPFFVGDPLSRFLAPRTRAGSPLGMLVASLFGVEAGHVHDDVLAWYRGVSDTIIESVPHLHLAIGRALVERGARSDAQVALARAAAQWNDERPDSEAVWWLGLLYARANVHDEFLVHARDFAAQTEDAASWLPELERRVGELRHRLPCALVVGVERHASPDVSPAVGAAADARSFRDALVNHGGVPVENAVLLLDEEATAARIVERFEGLLAEAAGRQVIFYYAGHGTGGRDGAAIVGFDARLDGVEDLLIARLGALANAAPNNIATIFDADFVDPWFGRTRYVPPDPRVPTMMSRDFGAAEVEPRQAVGRTVILSRDGVRITAGLVDRLATSVRGELTWWAWVSPGANGIEMGSDQRDAPIFHDAQAAAELESMWTRTRHLPWRQAVINLGKMLERLQEPRARVNALVDIGVAHLLMGDHARAASELNRAVATAGDDEHAEASFYLGRALLALKRDLAQAQSQLEYAASLRPDDAAVQYYLGAAIKAYFETDSLKKARDAWTTYLAMNAPLGFRAEVQAFLDSLNTR